MAKEQKRAQLQMLLVNKFRNKFNINGTTEMDIDKIIREEIKDLLADGKTYESNLNKLDKKLEVIIKQARQKNKAGAQQNNVSAPVQRGSNSGGAAKRSGALSPTGSQCGSNQIQNFLHSQKSNAGSNYNVSNIAKPKSRLVYEDPAAALNVSEDQWNNIVQNNLKKYHEENAKAL